MSLLGVHVMERDELLRLRREGGAWLRRMRENAGLSQRDLATAVGADYYSFISQLEAGKGRVPVAQVELWAKALKVRRSEFAKGLLKYYDPLTYDMLFNDVSEVSGEVLSESTSGTRPERTSAGDYPPPVGIQSSNNHSSSETTHVLNVDDLLARISRLEAILMMRGVRP